MPRAPHCRPALILAVLQLRPSCYVGMNGVDRKIAIDVVIGRSGQAGAGMTPQAHHSDDEVTGEYAECC